MRYGHAYGGASPTNVANAANYYLVDVANGDGRKVDLLQGRSRRVHRGHHCGLGELRSLEKVKDSLLLLETWHVSDASTHFSKGISEGKLL